jgi:hypothetical protein
MLAPEVLIWAKVSTKDLKQENAKSIKELGILIIVLR